MEVEQEKRDKLASARKKLNEYKLNRSTSGRSNVASSQPADVPSFYQNLNSPAASFNIFNPVAGNNNTASSNPYYTAAASASPVSGESTAFQSNDGVDSMTQPQNIQFLPIQHQFASSPVSTSDTNQTENVHQINPFSMSSGLVKTHSAESDGSKSSKQGVAGDVGLQSSTPPLLFPVNTFVDSQGVRDEHSSQQEQIVHSSGNIQKEEEGKKQELLEESLKTPEKSNDVPTLISSITEIEVNTISMEQQTLGSPVLEMTAVDTSSQSLNNQNYSSIFAETPQPDNNNIDDVAGLQKQHPTDKNEPESVPVPVFASSLFSAANNELINIFNIGQNSQPSIVYPNEVLPQTEPEDTSKDVSDTSPVTAFSNSNDAEAMSQLFQPLSDQSDGSRLSETSGNDMMAFGNEAVAVESNENSFTPMESQPLNVTSNHSSSSINSGTNVIFSTVQSSLAEPQEPETMHYEMSGASNNSNVSPESIQQMKSVQEAQELQIEELRRENAYLLGRQTELTFRIEESEKLAHEFKLEKDRVREEASTTSQALRARINSLCEENQRIVKNSTDVGVDLRAKMEEKSKQLEEMQKAVIVVSQSKMDFAGRLDHELERVKELQSLLEEKDEVIASLRVENTEMQEKLKQDHQKDAIIHQLQDQARHYQVQCETLQRELAALRSKNQQNVNVSHPKGDTGQAKAGPHSVHSHYVPAGPETVNGDTNDSAHNHAETSKCVGESGTIIQSDISYVNNKHDDKSLKASCQLSENHDHVHQDGDAHHHDCGSHDSDHHHDHSGDHHHHDHSGDHHHHDHTGDHHGDHLHHDHSADHHHHDHSGHDHHHEGHLHPHGDHDHHHHHAEGHQDYNEKVVARKGPSDELTELKKTLHRLEWENSSYRNEMDSFAADARQKRTYEEKCSILESENLRLKKEVEQLEHVIIQLQGENDTIGDYITLYQTQKMALKECAKQKDAQLELLAREREILLHRLAELTALVKDLKDSKSEAGSQCADDHTHTLDSVISPPNNKRQLEGKIRDLLTEISSSSLVENFHPCAVCSGRLMTV